MKLIVGLGNPGKKYEKTRHNCGFMAVDYYAKKYNLEFKEKFNALYSELLINEEKVIIIKPQTFMNLSGNSVLKFVKYYNICIEDILIIYDDKDYDIGTFKIKRDGSSGGHNGMQNIIDNLKTSNIKRIRIGISKNEDLLIDYVLSKFSKKELEKLEQILPTISDAIDEFINNDIDKAMEKYNRK